MVVNVKAAYNQYMGVVILCGGGLCVCILYEVLDALLCVVLTAILGVLHIWVHTMRIYYMYMHAWLIQRRVFCTSVLSLTLGACARVTVVSLSVCVSVCVCVCICYRSSVTLR